MRYDTESTACRLLYLLLLLQSRGRKNEPALARELEVSVRTVYCDVDAPSAAGIPVLAKCGPAGGFALLDRYRILLTGLTGDETGSLALTCVPGDRGGVGPGERPGIGRIQGTCGDDLIFGSAGDDRITAGRGGADTIDGEDGLDLLLGDIRDPADCNEAASCDEITGSATGVAGNDSITGGRAGDTLWGDEGEDYPFGSRGDDTLIGGNAPGDADETDRCDGGCGRITLTRCP